MITRRRVPSKLLAAVTLPVLAIALLAGCTETANVGNGTIGYASGDAVYKEIAASDRKAPVNYTSKLDSGEKVTAKQYLGTVHVVNFWYAGCPPCRKEAPSLESVYKKYNGDVPFLGVNIYDQAALSKSFAKKFGVTYPSALDVNDANIQSAFAGVVPANAVPTTLVIDQKGRVAARVTGLLESKSILEDMIDKVVAEGS